MTLPFLKFPPGSTGKTQTFFCRIYTETQSLKTMTGTLGSQLPDSLRKMEWHIMTALPHTGKQIPYQPALQGQWL